MLYNLKYLSNAEMHLTPATRPETGSTAMGSVLRSSKNYAVTLKNMASGTSMTEVIPTTNEV